MELARIAEFGDLTAAFVRGYGGNPLLEIEEARALLYRLDAALMLAIVFLSEAPDPVLTGTALDRVDDLVKKISRR